MQQPSVYELILVLFLSILTRLQGDRRTSFIFIMTILKPPRLKKGDIIGIAAPASPPTSSDILAKGIRYLEQLGYRIMIGKHLYEKHGYLAGADNHRAADINRMFSNPKVKAIFTVRGGYGTHRILPMLNYNAIKRNPKIFVGYSDITALQLAIFARTGLVMFSGPMVATELGKSFRGSAEEQFWQCLTSTKPPGVVNNPDQKSMKPLNRGVTAGRFLAGNLSLVTALLGTPYFPSLRGSILAIEEIEEPPYKIDRMLHHLKLSRVFDQVRGVVLGKFTNCKPTSSKTPSLTLPQVFKEVFASYEHPVLTGLHYGHVNGSLTLPIGIMTKLNASRGSLEFLESPVE